MAKCFTRYLLLSLLVTSLISCTTPSPTSTFVATSTPEPVAGSPGIGDPYYPGWGNGGYDVQNYVIVLDIGPATDTLIGSTTITATAAQRLSSFNLDLHGLAVETINVNDKLAEFSRNEDELIVTPPMILEPDQQFTVVVSYNGKPELIKSTPIDFEMGWSNSNTGAINVWGEPSAAATWFPNNNHPRDKATYHFEITVPKPWMVAASGALKETKEDGNKTLFVWDMDKPMATYLVTINIDQYELFTQSGPNGITIRDYFPKDLPASFRTGYDILPSAIDFFSTLFGPYPFDEYGVVVATPNGICANTPLALEAQTLSLHCPVMHSEDVIVHELAHQWFGDSVSLENWQDIWLKEGFATYAEWLWKSRNDPVAMARITKNRDSLFFDKDFPVALPSSDNLYTDESYTGGALVLNALRLKVGDDLFFKILQTYTERYRYGNAGTNEFIAVANEISRQDLKDFFDQWVYSKRLPDLPKQ